MSMQDQIINHDEGSLLVMASAGSGKTSVLTNRIKWLLSNKGSKFHVLALTFTNKAAQELNERLKDVRDIDKRAFVGTFHSFCLDVIQRHGYAIGLKEQPVIFEKNEDRYNLLIQVFQKPENWDLRKYYEDKKIVEQQNFIDNALAYISKKKKQLKGVKKFEYLDSDLENELFQKMYREYNDLLTLQNAIDFDDVLIKAYQIFSEREAVVKMYRKQYKYIFIDEAQDLNFAQYELLKIICGSEHKNVMMVGDIKQSLYHFNGSDIIYMQKKFVEDFDAIIKELNTNYRSSKAIISVANAIFTESMMGFNTQIKGKFKIFNDCENEKSEAIKIVDEVEKYLFVRKYEEDNFYEEIKESDIAIIARSRYLLNEIQTELDCRKIKYYFKKGSDGLLFESQLMKVFDLGIRLIINPLDIIHFNQLLDVLGINASTNDFNQKLGIDKLEHILNYLDDNQYFPTLIKCWKILCSQSKFNLRAAIAPIEDYINSDISKFNKETNGVESDLSQEIRAIQSDLSEINKYYSIYSKNTHSDLKSLSHFKTQLSLGLIIPNVEESGVVLSTIHLTKGLEYLIVFVAGLDDGSLPYYKSKNLGGKALLEEKNIFYVAVTRAKRALYLSYPNSRTMPWNPDKPKKTLPSEFLMGLNKHES